MRISLKQIISWVVFFALGMAALAAPHDLVNMMAQASWSFLVLLGCGLCFASGYKDRFFWRGFTAVTILYFAGMTMSNSDYRNEGQITDHVLMQVFKGMHPTYAEAGLLPDFGAGASARNAFNDIAVDLDAARSGSPSDAVEKPSAREKLYEEFPPNFYRIGHSLIGLLLGVFMGTITQMVAVSKENSTTSD